ncbi:MAG: amino acid transporter [Acidobacteria bacterium]|nr:amino acid transporter [Acidobacteriota bacterium]
MAATAIRRMTPAGGVREWMLKGLHETQTPEGPHEREGQHHQHGWWKVMCLTGVDYFSTLGYQPGIAFLAAGALAPVATLILVLLTLFGALPIYRRVAEESPRGEGSISMLEHLLSRWKGKLFVLVLLGFVATDFIITITLSAADATAHVIENPFVLHAAEGIGWHVESTGWEIGITLVFVALLGAVFLKGFKEAIGIAVVLVAVYLLLNFVVVARGLYELATHPGLLSGWTDRLMTAQVHGRSVGGNVFLMIGFSLLLFPKLALGLSGFETGVAVMPLVKGEASDTHSNPHGRILNTRKLLTYAALIMSAFLITSSLITSSVIPEEAFRAADPPAGVEKGEANGRALAYLAHHFLGDAFGTAYDLSTILILWFAGASAMAGLLNIVPRYLPRYGMAPNWAKATRPLVLVYAAVAVTISEVRRRGWGARAVAFAVITLVFLYTTGVNIYERTDGIKIASFFIGAIVLMSLLSRVWRTTELRVERIELDDAARRFIEEATRGRADIRIIANRRDTGDVSEYEMKEREKRDDNHIPTRDPVLFFEVRPCDASQFTLAMSVSGVEVGGHRILRAESPAVPNAIAAFLLHLRDTTGKVPHVYFGWSEGNPLAYLFKYIAFGEGDTAPVTHEVLRQAEEDPEKRPVVHVGG